MKHKPRPMSNQEAFNNVYEYFVKEKHPLAFAENKSDCCYRITLKQGLTVGCAIGCQMPDNLAYKHERGIRSPSVSSILNDKEVAEYFKYVNVNFLEDLQDAHDFHNSWAKGIKYALIQLAKRWNLQVMAD
jgi:hypothetical protein